MGYSDRAMWRQIISAGVRQRYHFWMTFEPWMSNMMTEYSCNELLCQDVFGGTTGLFKSQIG